MSDIKDVLDRIDTLKAKKSELMAESTSLRPELEKGSGADAGKIERARNVMKGLERVNAELEAADGEYCALLLDGVKAGYYDEGTESGDGSWLQPRLSTKGGHNIAPADSFGQAVAKAGFNLKSKPSVTVSGFDALKSTFMASTAWGRTQASMVPMGRDSRFLYPLLPTENANNVLSIEDWKQTARSLTGTVERAIDAVTDKADLDVTIALVNEAMKQHAVTIDEVPNAILESIPRLVQFLQAEATFQVQKSIDTHVYAQIVAASPPFGNTGANLIDKARNAISSMRAEGANPTILVLNPTDAVTLDTYQSTDGVYLVDPSRTNGQDPLWGMRVVERIGAGNEPPYVIDPQMLGVLYIGRMAFDADPYTNFKKNLTTLRVETSALFHVRNAKGARRIAAT